MGPAGEGERGELLSPSSPPCLCPPPQNKISLRRPRDSHGTSSSYHWRHDPSWFRIQRCWHPERVPYSKSSSKKPTRFRSSGLARKSLNFLVATKMGIPNSVKPMNSGSEFMQSRAPTAAPAITMVEQQTYLAWLNMRSPQAMQLNKAGDVHV